MNKLSKFGIITLSTVALSTAVPTLVHAEENVAPQPNTAARTTAQPTTAPKNNGSWVDYSMLDSTAKPKPGNEISKLAENPVEKPAPVEKPSTEGNILENGSGEANELKEHAEIDKKYNVDPTNKLPEPGLPIVTPEPEQPLNPEEMKKMVAEDLAYKKGAAKTQEEYDKLIAAANRELLAADGVDVDKLIHTPIPGKPGAVPVFSDISVRKYEIQADFLDADRVKEHGYTDKSRIDSPKRAEVSSTWDVHDKDSADGILSAPKIPGYTFSHVVIAAADHPDIDPDPKIVRVSYEAAYALRGSGYKNGKGDNIFHYYFIYTKNKQVEEKPKPVENNLVENPTVTPKPVENNLVENPTVTPKPVENNLVENPTVTPKPAEKPSVSEEPATPAKNAGLPKIPYRKDQPKRWFNGAGRPTLTTDDLAIPLPTEDVEKTSHGWWTAEPDFLHAGSHIKTSTFSSNFNGPMFENGKKLIFKDGFKDMDSRFRPALVRVKVPELEGMNYEAYTVFYENLDKNGNPTYGANQTLQGGGIALNFKSKENKEDIKVYTLTKDKKLEELYFIGDPREDKDRYDEKTKTHSYSLPGETYQTFVFFFNSPAEKPIIPAEQPQPTKPVKPAEKPSEKPVNPVTPVAPITPTTPVTPTLNPAIPNNTRVLSNKAGSVRVHGSEATLKNVSYIKVEETKPTSLESKDYKAFDIHLYDANGKAIQPNGMVLVSLSADKPVENVYYVAPDGTLQALKFKQDTDKVTFETNHFSIYAMTFKIAASRDNGKIVEPVVVHQEQTAQTSPQTDVKVATNNIQPTDVAPLATSKIADTKKVLPNTGEKTSNFGLFSLIAFFAGLLGLRIKSKAE